MATFSRPAVQVQQGNLTLYLTYVTPRDLFGDNFYTVEALEPKGQDSKGYQRILNERRASRLSRHLTEADKHGYAHLPTTVFLATSKYVRFHNGLIEFEKEDVCPFSVVDGQHRIEGLRKAVAVEESLMDFPLPVTIATELDSVHQMYHFFIVNTTQVPVEPALRQQITRRFTDMRGIEDLSYTPYWMQNEINRGRDARALKIAEFLNDDPKSPLFKRIRMANDPVSKNKINQNSFVNVFKEHVLTGSNPLAVQETDVDRQSRIMLNYFHAVDDIFVAGRERADTVVYKNNGLFFFLGISKWVFNVIYSSSNKDFRVNSVRTIIKDALGYLDDAYEDLANPDWWMSGQGASSLNRAVMRRYIEEFQIALSLAQSQSRESQDIQI